MCGNTSFKETALPKTIEEYFQFIRNEYTFLDKRNARIKKFCEENGL